jgi:nucleotide-binding universal stress UspA family protein
VEAGLEEVVFLYVLDRDEVGFVPYGGFDKELAKELKLKARLEFEDWGRELEAKGLCWKSVVEVGNPEPKILEVAEREDVDMIIAGRHLGILDSIIPSGTEFDILRDAPVPVLFMVSEVDHVDSEPLLGHILFATDFSPHSVEALDFLAGLGSSAGKVSLLHIIESCDFEEVSRDGEPSCEAKSEEALAELENALREEGLDVESHLLYGDPANEILHFADERGATLIIAGSRGKRGIEEYFVGSVASKIVRETKVPAAFIPFEVKSA